MNSLDPTIQPSPKSLILRDRNFRRLWSAVTVSGVSSHIGYLAMPLVAITSFKADAPQLGILAAVQLLPVFLLTPLAGALVDSLPARGINSLCDLARGILLLSVPLLAFFDALTMVWLYVIAAVIGSFEAVGDVAHHTMLPRVVDEKQIVAGNSAINASWSVTDVAGPGLAGLLIQALTAPFALAANAIGFLASGLLIRSIHMRPEPLAERPHRLMSHWLAMIKSGFAFLRRHPPLLMLGLSGGVANLFIQAYVTIFVLYAVNDLGLEPVGLGALYAVGALGGIVGAAIASWVADQLSRVGALVAGNLAVGAGMIVVGSAGLLDRPFQVVLVALGVALYSGGLGVYNVHSMSTRQQATPLAMLGRVTASYRLLSHGSLPLGAVLGGFTAHWIGLGWTCALAGLLLSVWMFLVLLTPFRRLNTLGEPAHEADVPATVSTTDRKPQPPTAEGTVLVDGEGR